MTSVSWRHRLFRVLEHTASTRKESGISQQELRVNDRIRIPRVRVVDPEGNQIGIIETAKALELASQQDLDLVEVAPQADPPVCRIMDYGKYKYEQDVQQRAARKKQSQVVVKEMKMRPKIDTHDYETKKGHVVRFLQQGAKVKLTIMFRGREAVHPELGERLLVQLADEVSHIAKIATPPKLDGRNMTMVLDPLKEAVAQKPSSEHKKSKPDEQRRAPAPKKPEDKEPAKPAKPKPPVKVTRAEGG